MGSRLFRFEAIDERILEKNPLKGKWGYGPAVKKKKRGDAVKIVQKNIDAQDMWFFHPNAKESDIPDNCTIMGEWVQPESKEAKSGRKGKKGWGLFGSKGSGGERRKIIPGGQKKKQKSDSSEEEEPLEEVVPKTPPPTSKTPKRSSLKGSSSHSASSKSKTKSSTKKKSKEGKAAVGKPPITPTSTRTKTQKPKPSSFASLNSSMGSVDFESSMSSIKSPPGNPNKKSVTPNSPGSLHSSLGSLNSSKRSLGSDDFQLVIRRQPDLETFTLIVQPSYKIAQLKQKINRFRGIPLDAIRLSYKDKDLNAVAKKETLVTLGIRNRVQSRCVGFST